MSKKLKYVVGADTDAARSALEKLGDTLAKVGEGFKKAGGDADAVGDAVQLASQKAAETAKKVETAFRTLHVRSTATAQKQKDNLVKAYEAIRTSGTASASDIRRAHDVLEAKLKRIDDELKTGTLRYRLFGKEARETYGKISSAAGSALKVVRNVALGLAGASTVAGVAIYKTAKGTADYADEIGKMAERSGIGPEALSALRMAAEQGDITFEQLGAGIKRFNLALASAGLKEEEVFARLRADLAAAGDDEEKIAAAKEKADDALNDPFRALGVETRTARGKLRATIDLLKDVADRIKDMPDPARKLEMSSRFFGREGGEQFLTLVNAGSEGLRRYEEEVRRLGLEVSASLSAQGQEFNDTLDTLGKAWQGVRNAIGAEVLDEWTKLFGTLTDILVRNRDRIAGTLGKLSEAFSTFLLDIAYLFAGEEARVANTWLITLRNDLRDMLPSWDEMKGAVQNFLPTLGELAKGLQNVAHAFEAIWNWATMPSRGVGVIGALAASMLPGGVSPADAMGAVLEDWGDARFKFASGGMVRGPGSGTSDSILARLSNGEFVMSAAAVRKYGAGMLARMNAMAMPSYRLPTPRTGRAMPAFAAGGLVGGGVTRLELSLGGKVFNMQASGQTVKELAQHVRTAERRRITTSQPPWVKS
ncbi:MAG TPA: hypothetical protein DCW68_02590 [Rhodospirillaceae bacterium]|nr:MAG: hypothetical protein A2018_05565 [Alphaproteobacteria bacterium GWF2_58_20]HAU28982.1 hypothetical protein [Rhodospirillaceae bacterium]